MKISSKNFLWLTLSFAWLLIIIFLFLVANRVSYVYLSAFPSVNHFFLILSRILPGNFFYDSFLAFLQIFLFFISCLSLGLRVLNLFSIPKLNLLGFGITAFLLGEILYSFLFLTMIRIINLTPIFVSLSLITGLMAGFSLSTAFFVDYFQRIRAINLNKKESVLAILIIVNLASAIFLASTRLGYDSTAEYFSHSKIMAVSHLPIYLYPNNSIVVSAFHPGILFTALIQVFGDQSARLLSWLNGMVILILGLAIGNRTGLSPRANLYFLILMITSTAFIDLLGDGKVELISTAPILCAIYWMIESNNHRSKSVFLLIGLLAGFSIIARPYNIFLVSLFVIFFYIFVFLYYLKLYKNNFKVSIKEMLIVFWIIPTLIFSGSFHLWQNAAWLGSPIAPIEYYQTVDSSVWAWQFDPALLNVMRLLYPLTITIFNTPQSLGNISPMFIGFLPMVLLFKTLKRGYFKSELSWLLLSALFVLILWITYFFTVVEIRYVFFLWVIIFISMSYLIDSIFSLFTFPVQTIIHIAMIGLTGYMAFRTLVMSLTSYAPIDNTGQAICYDLELCTFFNSINESAAIGDRVFVLFAYRYYLRPDLFACSSQAGEYRSLQKIALESPSSFWVTLYSQGFRYIVFEKHLAEKRYQFGNLPNLETLPKGLKLETIFLSEDQSNIVYRLSSTEANFDSQKKCIKTENETWQVIFNVNK